MQLAMGLSSLHVQQPANIAAWVANICCCLFYSLLQVLGLTNYSHWEKAADMRSCMLKHDDIAGVCKVSSGVVCRSAVAAQGRGGGVFG